MKLSLWRVSSTRLSFLQLCFAPCFLAAFFCVSGAVNGLTVEDNVSKLKRVSITFLFVSVFDLL